MNVSDVQIRSAIIQVAADWYAAHRIRTLSESERAGFLAWLKASPLHLEEYLGVAALERTLGAVIADSSLSIDEWIDMARGGSDDVIVDFGGAISPYESPRARAVGRDWRRIAVGACVSVAASVSVAAMVALWWVRGGSDRPGTAKTYKTNHGQQGVWPLPDGSTLHVNTDTAVTVRFSEAERIVDVDHGEVVVEVAHGDKRAFRVHAGSTDAVAIGTEFDVYRRPDSTLITVVAGQVAVSVGRFVPPQGPGIRLSSGLRVGAGQQVRVIAGVLPSAAEPADVREATAWLKRKIIFDQRSLGAVADEFNRYNDIAFSIEDPDLRRMAISGSFNAADTDSFAAFLESLDGVRVERLPTRFKVVGSHAKHRTTVRGS